MKDSAHVPQSVEVEDEDQQASLCPDSPVFAAMHSEENIENWMGYLPEDCIETMIRVGWNYTT